MLFFSEFRGELAALGAALLWALASFIYIGLGQRMPPLVLNFCKSGIAIVLIALTLLLRGDRSPDMSLGSLGLLTLSGAIGIGFGDTAFFACLNCLGARRSLLMEALAPPLAALFAMQFLGEQLALVAWFGILLTIAGVAWVVVERTPDDPQGHDRSLRGIGYGVLAALGQAGGAVLSRSALAGTAASPLWSTLIRLSAGVAILLLIGVRPSVLSSFKPLASPRFLAILTGTAFIGTYVAIWLQQTALKYTEAGIAQALTATSPLFVLPIALILGEQVSLRAFLGVITTLVGVWLLFQG